MDGKLGKHKPKGNEKTKITSKYERKIVKPIESADPDFSTVEKEVGHKYEVTSQIGAGSYGNVYEAYERETNKRVAIKSIHSIFDDLVDCKRIMREIKILRHLDCNYAVKLYDIVPPKHRHSFNRLNIVLEYADSDLK